MANSLEETRARLEARYECPVSLILSQGLLNPNLPENLVHFKINLPWMAQYGEWLFFAPEDQTDERIEAIIDEWIAHNRDLPLTEWKDRNSEGKWVPPDSYTASQRRKKQGVLDSGGTIAS